MAFNKAYWNFADVFFYFVYDVISAYSTYESFNSPMISFHVFFADNDGWHLTAVDLLSTDSHKGAGYVRRRT